MSEGTHSRLQAASSDLRKLEAEVAKLCSQIVDVTDALSARTSRATRLTVAHAATAAALSREASLSLAKLEESSAVFMNDLTALRNHFDVLNELARQTAAVRAELVALEMQVTKLMAKSNSRQVAGPVPYK